MNDCFGTSHFQQILIIFIFENKERYRPATHIESCGTTVSAARHIISYNILRQTEKTSLKRSIDKK